MILLDDEEKYVPSAADFSPLVAVLWMLGAFATMVSLAFVLLSVSPESRSDLVGLGIVSAAAFVFVSALLVGRYPSGSRLAQAVGLRAIRPVTWPLALLIGILSQVPAEAIQRAVDRSWPLSASQLAARSEMLRAESTLEGWALVFVIALLVPLSEEVFFRGAVYGALRRGRVNELRAALISGLGFAFCHFNARLLLPLVLVACILGLLRSVSGSLWPALIAHIGFNSVPVLSNVLGLDLQADLPWLWQAVSLAVLGLLVGGCMVYVRQDPLSVMNRSEEAQDGASHIEEVRHA